MRVYLCRHALAAAGDPDELRALIPEGLDQARALGDALATHPDPPVLVLSSPLLRARQTADAIASAVGVPLQIADELAPGATLETLTRLLDGIPGPLAVVGHQPDCSEIAYALTGRDPGFPVAGMVALELGA